MQKITDVRRYCRTSVIPIFLEILLASASTVEDDESSRQGCKRADPGSRIDLGAWLLSHGNSAGAQCQ